MENIYYNLAEQKMKFVSFLMEEAEEMNLQKTIARELQKIKLIPLDMFSAKEAISNIVVAEISRKTIPFNRTISSLMSLDLSNVNVRSKFRFDNYYKRFFKSRSRGFDFEGMIAGFLDGDISDDINSPYDMYADQKRISLKSLNSNKESVVIKSIAKSLKKYLIDYNGSHENKNQLEQIFLNKNPIKLLINSENNDLSNVAEDIVRMTLDDIDCLLIGIPNENNTVSLFYYSVEKIIQLATNPNFLMEPKSSGSKQIRLSSQILTQADIFGKITFPNLTDKDYREFLIGNEDTKKTQTILNKFGNKYGIKNLGGQLPQDIVSDLSKNNQFITDMDFIIGDKNLEI